MAISDNNPNTANFNGFMQSTTTTSGTICPTCNQWTTTPYYSYTVPPMQTMTVKQKNGLLSTLSYMLSNTRLDPATVIEVEDKIREILKSINVS